MGKLTSDDTVLQANLAVFASVAPLLIASNKFGDVALGDHNPSTRRRLGIGAGIAAGSAWAAQSAEPKKNLLKVLGVAWVSTAVLSSVHVHNKTQPRDIGILGAVVEGTIGAVNLVQAFRQA